MKANVGYLLLGLTVFAGVAGANQFTKWLDNRSAPQARLSAGEPYSSVTPLAVPPARFVVDQSSGPADFRAAAKRVLPSVVSVDRLEEYADLMGRVQGVRETGTGSGVIIGGDGTIVTNNHVVEGAKQVRVRLNDHRSLMAEVLGTDQRTDLAVIRIKAENLSPIELGDSSQVEVGQWVLAIGNPLGYSGTVSAGVVSSLSRNLTTEESFLTDAIQTDAAINQGNSGGALTDSQGRLIGINSAIASNSGGGSIGIGFAIPVNRVKTIAKDIVSFGRARHAGLGVKLVKPKFDGVLESDNLLRERYKAQVGAEPPRQGLIVFSVPPGTPGAQAGMADGDVLLAIDDIPMLTRLDMFQALNDKRPGDVAKIKFWSRGNVKVQSVKLQELRQ